MLRRATMIATALVLALSATVAPATATTAPVPSSESLTTTASSIPDGSVETTFPITAAAPIAQASAPTYRYMPKIRKGMHKSKVTRLMKRADFKVKYRYTYGKKNRVVKTSVSKYWKSWPRAKWNKKHTRKMYKGRAVLTVTLGNGKKPRPWRTGTATWYSIADNTPAGSRQTSSGHPLGSFGGWTFASTKFPMGTKLLIKHGGKKHVVICTDRGGLHTIDLFKPASDRLGMGGMSKFKYQVIRRGWRG